MLTHGRVEEDGRQIGLGRRSFEVEELGHNGGVAAFDVGIGVGPSGLLNQAAARRTLPWTF